MKWVFPSVPAGEYKGLNESGIQIFREDVVSGLAREICQNSLDARDPKIDPSLPIRVEFKHFKINQEEFPDLHHFCKELKACKDTAIKANDKRVEEWAESRLKILSAKQIDILRISDFNTTGLLGSRTSNHTLPWGSLVNARESSVKSDTAGGSFGIGKFAAFACSTIRAVLYSTYSNDNVEAHQGVARLVSSKKLVDGKSETTTGFGFYGNPDGSPSNFQATLDKGFIRKEGEYGTDIYILGFSTFYEDPQLWKESIIISALNGFLLAIFNRKLEIQINDIVISASNLDGIINDFRNHQKCIAFEYYDVLTSKDTVWKTDENFQSHYGEIKLGILVKEGYRRKIAGIRSTGMLVQEFRKKNFFIDYAGVLIVNGAPINELLRKMENPQHTKWSADLLNDNKQLGRSVLAGINLLIDKLLSDIISGQDVDEFDANVGDFLPDIEENIDERVGDTEILSDKIEEIVKSRKTIEAPRRSDKIDSYGDFPSEDSGELSPNEEIIGGSGHGDGRSSNDGEGYGFGFGNGLGGVQSGTLSTFGSIQIKKLRLVSIDRSKNTYLLSITPSLSSNNATIQVYIVAENRNGDMPAQITDCKITGQIVDVSGNAIKNVILQEDKPLKIVFSISFDELCSMEFKINGYRLGMHSVQA